MPLDLTQYVSPGVDVVNLHPSFSSNLAKALAAGPPGLSAPDREPYIDSGYRNNADQKRAIEHIWHAKHGAKPVPAKVYQNGIPGLVAGIGKSAHARGGAVDMPGLTPAELAWLRKHGPAYGVVPLAGKAQRTDPVHFQAVNAYSLPFKDVPHVAVGPRPNPVSASVPSPDLTFTVIAIVATIIFLLTRLKHGPVQSRPVADVPARQSPVA